MYDKTNGGQGRIRTSVARKERQIYSLLPLTTRPPVRLATRSRQTANGIAGKGPRRYNIRGLIGVKFSIAKDGGCANTRPTRKFPAALESCWDQHR